MPFLSRFSLDAFSWPEKMMDPVQVDTRKRALAWISVFTAYLLTAQIGIYLYRDIGTSPALIWPPVGIALAAVLIEGYWIASAIAVGALVNALMVGTVPPFIMLGAVIANTVQPIIGGHILRKLHFNALMNTLRDVFLLVSVAFLVTAIMPLINFGFAVSYNFLFAATRQLPAWPTIWLGGALSALILIPFLSRWIGHDLTERTRLQQLEAICSIGAVSALSYFLFATPYTSFFGTSMFIFLIGGLFWIAFRVGPRMMSLALLVMTAISIAGAIYGIHPPSSTNTTLSQRLISTEMFDLIFAFFFFILVSVEEQRKEAIKTLSQDAEQLANALETIRSEDRAKNEFIATLAHELRNPLAPVISGLELLRLGETDTERIEIIDSAQRQTHVMRRLLDELLDVARIARRTFIPRKEDLVLQSVLEQSIKGVEFFFKERQQKFSSTLPDEKLWVHGDPVRLMQVFSNLLFNAGKYTEPGGKIELTLKKSGSRAIICVQDNGMGIENSMLERIFEPFVQDRYSSPVGSGLGVGLSIAKRLVELHDGTIVATSSGKGKGSTFTIELPILVGPGKMNVTQSNVDVPPTTILVVDDNKDAAESMAKLLRTRGHIVEVALTGQEALKAFSKRPNTVLLDIGLPDIDGLEIARKMLALEKGTTIIALSGYGSSYDKHRAMEAGIAKHITKPASLADIEASLVRQQNKA